MKNDGLLNTQYRQMFDLAKDYEHGQRAVKSADADRISELEKSQQNEEAPSAPNAKRKRSSLFV